jgi:hypothetical protein
MTDALRKALDQPMSRRFIWGVNLSAVVVLWLTIYGLIRLGEWAWHRSGL